MSMTERLNMNEELNDLEDTNFPETDSLYFEDGPESFNWDVTDHSDI